MAWPPIFDMSDASYRRWRAWRVQTELREGWTFRTRIWGDRLHWDAAVEEISLLKRVRPIVEAIDWGAVRDG